LEDIDLGFKTKGLNERKDSVVVERKKLFFFFLDTTVDTAAKILRLLHIKELRDLQTRINETIVSVQSITANPKTDTKLGKVGV